MLRFLVSDLQSLDLGQNVVSQMLGDYEDDTINEDEHDLRDFLVNFLFNINSIVQDKLKVFF